MQAMHKVSVITGRGIDLPAEKQGLPRRGVKFRFFCGYRDYRACLDVERARSHRRERAANCLHSAEVTM
jgi:hypothetical protein